MECDYILAKYVCLVQGQIGNLCLNSARSSSSLKGYYKKSGREPGATSGRKSANWSDNRAFTNRS